MTEAFEEKTIIDDYRDAKGQDIQPYYAAFMIEFGYRSPDEAKDNSGGQSNYILWNMNRWHEFGELNGIHKECRHLYHREFHQWLASRALDFAARHHIEAAQVEGRPEAA